MNDKPVRKRQPPFSLWLSPEEKAEIKSRAERAGLSMGGYCKSVLFNTPAPRRSRVPSPDKLALSQLLGQIGAVGNNINQIAKSLHMTSAVDIVELDHAINDIAEIRAAVMKALGYHETPNSDHNPDVQSTVSEQYDDH